jgi:hypothetical protein
LTRLSLGDHSPAKLTSTPYTIGTNFDAITMESSAIDQKDESMVVAESATIRLQAFIRGSLCRARVSIMVKRLIDELLMNAKQRYQQPKLGVDEIDEQIRTTGLGMYKTNEPPGLEYQQMNGNEMEHFTNLVAALPAAPTSDTNHEDSVMMNPRIPDTANVPSSSLSSPRRKKRDTVPLQSNSTKHVASSEDVLHEHEVGAVSCSWLPSWDTVVVLLYQHF